MKSHCLKNGVTDLSMPRIGCGLDRLQWENVSTIIEEVFEATDIRITVYTLWTDEHFGCDHVFLCQSYWAIGLGKLTSKMIRGKFHVKLSVTGHAWVSVFPWLDWDSEGGIAWEMLLWFFFSFLFRKVGNSLILGREPGVGPYDPFCPRMLPNLFGLPLGGSIDSTSLLFKRNFRKNNLQLILHFLSFVHWLCIIRMPSDSS